MTKSEIFLKAFEESMGNLAEACKKAGVTRLQVFDLADKNKNFQVKIWEITEGFIDLAESTLFKMGLVNGGAELIKYLDTKGVSRGYGKNNTEIENDPYPGVKKPKQKNPELEFKEQIRSSSVKEIKEALKKLKKIK